MPYQKVHIKIDKKSGVLSVEGDGFIGNQCDEISQIESQLGQIASVEDKPEKYQYLQPDLLPNQLG